MKKHKVVSAMFTTGVVGIIVGVLWAIVSYMMATWDIPAYKVTNHIRVAALWMPILVILVFVGLIFLCLAIDEKKVFKNWK